MWSFVVVILQKSVSGHWFWKRKKTKFLWPTSEHRGQEFGERSIVPKRRQIREVWLLMWSFLAVICRSQSLVFEKKKRNFFGLLPNTESNSLENALSFLNGDILEKLSFESGLFWWSFLSEQFRLQLNFCWLPVKGRLCTEISNSPT